MLAYPHVYVLADVDAPGAVRAAGDEAAFADGREHGVGVAVAEECGARACVLEQLHGIGVPIRVCGARAQQQQGGADASERVAVTDFIP
jgi:hypothetical protein